MRLFILNITRISFQQAIEKVMWLARNRTPSYVCFANAHMIAEAYNDKSLANFINSSNLVLADGMPLAIACKLLYGVVQQRIAGMDFLPRIIEVLNQEKDLHFKIFLYGSTEKVLKLLRSHIASNYPNVIVAGSISPPFRTLSWEELDDHIGLINQSGAHIVFLALGCPKQEKWMAQNYEKVNAVLLGVGGAFLTMVGIRKRAPKFMQRLGMEWISRLVQEPQRLFKRYMVTNTLFLSLFIKAIIIKLFYGKY
ncbi:MAG: WecB/TagA/CpsF family glycosyltransferase [Flavisolibacter sp.]